jgi:hypothetical protein
VDSLRQDQKKAINPSFISTIAVGNQISIDKHLSIMTTSDLPNGDAKQQPKIFDVDAVLQSLTPVRLVRFLIRVVLLTST